MYSRISGLLTPSDILVSNNIFSSHWDAYLKSRHILFFLHFNHSSLITCTPSHPPHTPHSNSQWEEKDSLTFRSLYPANLFPNLNDDSHVLIYLFLSIPSFLPSLIKCLFIFNYVLASRLDAGDTEMKNTKPQIWGFVV